MKICEKDNLIEQGSLSDIDYLQVEWVESFEASLLKISFFARNNTVEKCMHVYAEVEPRVNLHGKQILVTGNVIARGIDLYQRGR